jgi:hypothetical protein
LPAAPLRPHARAAETAETERAEQKHDPHPATMGSAPETVQGQEWDERKHFNGTAADSNREALKRTSL